MVQWAKKKRIKKKKTIKKPIRFIYIMSVWHFQKPNKKFQRGKQNKNKSTKQKRKKHFSLVWFGFMAYQLL